MVLNKHQRQSIQKLWSKLVTQLGFREDIGFPFGEAWSSTSQNLDFYVDPVNGNDGNPGTETQPFKTIEGALTNGDIPHIIKHTVMIHLKKGTYTESLTDAALSFEIRGGNLVFRGDDWIPVTPTTGPSTGTFTSFSGTTSNGLINRAIMTNAGWTPDDLKGKFIHVTGGPLATYAAGFDPGSASYFAIAGNSSDTIEVASGQLTDLSGASFEIVDHGAVWTNASSGYPIWIRSNINNGGTDQQLNFSRIRFNSTNYYAILAYGGALGFYNCAINSNWCGVWTGICGPYIYFYNCFIHGDTYGLYLDQANQVDFDSSVIDGGESGLRVFCGKRLRIINGYSRGGELVIQGSTNAGLESDSALLIEGNRLVIRKCKTGMYLCNHVNIELDGVEVFSNTGSGIEVATDTSGGTGCCELSLTNWLVHDNGGDGIAIGGPHNGLRIDGSAKIENNGGYGINLLQSPHSSHNTISVASSVTMSENTKGDFNLNSAASTSIADLRAATNTVLTNSDDFNRLKGL